MLTINWDKNERMSFEWYRSEICHLLKSSGDSDFISIVVGERWIPLFWEWQWYAEALYLVAIIDYLSDLYNVEKFNEYNFYRGFKLKSILYPQSVLINIRLFPEKYSSKTIIEKCQENPCSKYFIKYNIVEGDIRDVA